MSPEPYYVNAACVSHVWTDGYWQTEWNVMRRAKRGGDRFVARASSEASARRIVRALNAQEDS